MRALRVARLGRSSTSILMLIRSNWPLSPDEHLPSPNSMRLRWRACKVRYWALADVRSPAPPNVQFRVENGTPLVVGCLHVRHIKP